MRHLVFIKSQSLRTTPGRAQRAMGTPDHIAERLLGFEHAGVDLVLLQFSPQHDAMERFAQAVMPLNRPESSSSRWR